LPANEQVELDLNKPNELAKNICKEMNFHAMNLSTVMMAENDLMLLMVESVKSKEWPNGLAYVLWEKLIKKFKPSDKVGRQSKQQNCLV
jgi:hypothetical protein